MRCLFSNLILILVLFLFCANQSIYPQTDSSMGLIDETTLSDSISNTSRPDSTFLTTAEDINDTKAIEKDTAIVLDSNGSGKAINILKFYQKWWFSLLFILLTLALVLKYFKNKEAFSISTINKLSEEIKKLKSSLEEKDTELQKNNDDAKIIVTEEQELKFNAFGLSRFSEIISNNRNDLDKLGQDIISELVNYVGANSGIIYTINEDNNEYLEILSSYAPDNEKLNSSIHIGEGYVGTTFAEGTIMELDNVPEGYLKITSGLGKASPNYLAFIPLIQDEEKIGVIEIAAFHKFEKYKLEFIQKLSQNLASTILIKRSSERMGQMLEQSNIYSEELKSQEEEMRQNLEEMQATQEELQRQMNENKKIQDDLAKEKKLMDAIMDNLPEHIYFKDLESKFIKTSRSLAKLFGLKRAEELYGKSDFDFFDDEHARPAYEAEQKIIKTRKPIIDLVEKEIQKDGSVAYVTTTKMPLIDQYGNVIGTFGISKDITQMKKLEIESKEHTEELLAQEEEMRQNIEEMQTTQEELHRQIEETNKIQNDLAKEKSLMDAIMENVPEYIYFKDIKSRFIKTSHSMVKMFGLKKADELNGKSDFDFFDDEHARPAYEAEQEIIRTGKPILDLVEKEVKKDGSVTYVTTSKLPLKDKSGSIIGTFGISKDITHMKKLEMEAKEQNEELQAQEEELKQNLEEMQTIQEDLQKQLKENEKIKLEYMKKAKDSEKNKKR
jgi:PAS domain S-box-containing protein